MPRARRPAVNHGLCMSPLRNALTHGGCKGKVIMAIQSGVIFVASHTLIRKVFSGLIAQAKHLFQQSFFFYLSRLFSKQKSSTLFCSHLSKRREDKNSLLKQKYSDCEKTRSKKSKTEKAGTENICNFRTMIINAFSHPTLSKAFSSSLFHQRVLFSFCSCAFSDLKNFRTPAVNHFNSVTWQSPHKTALHRL